LSADLVRCMQASGNSFIQQRFFEHDRIFGTQESAETTSGARRVTKAKQYSVSMEFRTQLQHLMERIRSTEPHFVRCIKPNPRSVPHEINRKSVVEQLQYQGVLQAIEVSRAGFPMRLRHRQAVLDFRCLAPRQTQVQVEAQIARGKIDVAARLLFSSLGDGAVPGLSEGSWAVGKTLVFLKKRGIEVISSALLRLRNRKATVIEAAWRCSRLRRKYARCRRSAIRLQATVRRLVAKRRVALLRSWRSVVRLQSAERGRRARRDFRKWRKAALVIQAVQHARILRKNFLRSLRLLRKLQFYLRRHLRRQIQRRTSNAALLIQKSWRGYRGRRLANVVLAKVHRLRLACRRLLRLWRYKVCARLIEQSDGPLEERLKDSRPGELYAAASSLQDSYRRGVAEAHLLKFESEMLSLQVVEMQRWTLQGCVFRLLETILGIELEDRKDPQQAVSTPLTPRRADVDDLERWLAERNASSPARSAASSASPARSTHPQQDEACTTVACVNDRGTQEVGYFASTFCCTDRRLMVP
jgi:hypothetical protein